MLCAAPTIFTDGQEQAAKLLNDLGAFRVHDHHGDELCGVAPAHRLALSCVSGLVSWKDRIPVTSNHHGDALHNLAPAHRLALSCVFGIVSWKDRIPVTSNHHGDALHNLAPARRLAMSHLWLHPLRA